MSTHSELSSQYNVRGGSFDENSVYINPDMVESVGFSTGGFEAKYGDKMSSALDITYKKLKPKGKSKFYAEGNVAASLLGASGYVGMASKKFSWLNSVRYKTNRYLLGKMETKGEYTPNFLDYQTYFSWNPTKRTS